MRITGALSGAGSRGDGSQGKASHSLWSSQHCLSVSALLLQPSAEMCYCLHFLCSEPHQRSTTWGSKAGGLQMCMLQWSARFLQMMRIFNPANAIIFAKLYIHSFTWNLHKANPQPITFTLNPCGSVPANYTWQNIMFHNSEMGKK